MPDFSDTFDLLVIEGNRIVASTARVGRYAAGMPLFARDGERFETVLVRCAADPTHLHALPYLHELLLFGGAAISDTAMLPAVVVHGNPKRGVRLIRHCFFEQICFLMPQDSAAADGGRGLRQSDEPLYRALFNLLRVWRLLFRGAGTAVKVTTRAQVVSLLRDRMQIIFTLLSLPDTQWSEDELLPFPSVGAVELAPLNMMLLCLGLGLRTTGLSLSLRATADAEHLYPCFVLPMPRSDVGAADPCEHPSMVAAAGLALRFGMTFGCFMRSNGQGGDELVFRISPLQKQHSELYTLRDRDLARKPLACD